jgi:hypothetical protein
LRVSADGSLYPPDFPGLNKRFLLTVNCRRWGAVEFLTAPLSFSENKNDVKDGMDSTLFLSFIQMEK